MKYDNPEVLTYSIENRRPSFAEVTNALVEDKARVMKAAIVEPSQADGWGCLAKDRQSATGRLADYFSAYLQIIAAIDTLSQVKAISVCARVWAATSPDISTPAERARLQEVITHYLVSQPAYSVDSFIDHVAGSKGIARNRPRRQSLRSAIENSGLAEQFDLPDEIPFATRLGRQEYKTAEGVRVIMPDGPTAGNVKLERSGGEHIVTIRTSDLEVQK